MLNEGGREGKKMPLSHCFILCIWRQILSSGVQIMLRQEPKEKFRVFTKNMVMTFWPLVVLTVRWVCSLMTNKVFLNKSSNLWEGCLTTLYTEVRTLVQLVVIGSQDLWQRKVFLNIWYPANARDSMWDLLFVQNVIYHWFIILPFSKPTNLCFLLWIISPFPFPHSFY